MKIVISSNGKKVLKMTKKEWASIGKKAGWEEWDEESDFYNHLKKDSMELKNIREYIKILKIKMRTKTKIKKKNYIILG